MIECGKLCECEELRNYKRLFFENSLRNYKMCFGSGGMFIRSIGMHFHRLCVLNAYKCFFESIEMCFESIRLHFKIFWIYFESIQINFVFCINKKSYDCNSKSYEYILRPYECILNIYDYKCTSSYNVIRTTEGSYGVPYYKC